VPVTVPGAAAAVLVTGATACDAVEVTVLTAGVTAVSAAEETALAAPETVLAAPETVLAAPETVPDTVEVTEPGNPGEPDVVAACAGPASSRARPNARPRPPSTAPQVNNSTFRTGAYQPSIPATLVTQNTNV
jgi:hypothetical protein